MSIIRFKQPPWFIVRIVQLQGGSCTAPLYPLMYDHHMDTPNEHGHEYRRSSCTRRYILHGMYQFLVVFQYLRIHCSFRNPDASRLIIHQLPKGTIFSCNNPSFYQWSFSCYVSAGGVHPPICTNECVRML